MTSPSDFDQRPIAWGRHVLTKHACPACPSPLAAGLTIAPSVFCVYCHGSGLVDEPTLNRWCADTYRGAAAAATPR